MSGVSTIFIEGDNKNTGKGEVCGEGGTEGVNTQAEECQYSIEQIYPGHSGSNPFVRGMTVLLSAQGF